MKRTIGVALALVMGFFASPVLSQEKVRFLLDWVIAGRHTPYYVAIEKGFWKEGGLDVSLSRGFGGASTVKSVAAGSADVGFASSGPALVARAKGAPIKIIGVIYGKAPFMLVSRAKTGINGPKDLEGKLIGAREGEVIRFIFPAFARIAGIDTGKVKWVAIDAPAYAPSLLAGKIDAATYFIFDKIQYGKLAAKHGRFNFLLLADHGLDIYSIGLVAQDSYINGKANVVRAFVRGSIKAYEWTLNNPKAANEVFAKHQPTLNKEIALGELDIIRELVVTEEAKKHCIGWISQEKLTRTQKILFTALNVKESLDINQSYTTKFLPCG
ncbi:MAG: ABC transporter substrate-binding protein [Nitrospinota bacterium]